MRATIEDLQIPWQTIQLRTQGSLERLRDLVAYHDAPVATMTYLVHSMLSEEIHRGGFKVAFSGTSADELFTGYYDHYILHLAEMKKAGQGGGNETGDPANPSPGSEGAEGQGMQEMSIPAPEEFETPEAYRKALLEGMQGAVPEAYRATNRRYYEELVRQ